MSPENLLSYINSQFLQVCKIYFEIKKKIFINIITIYIIIG